ncbi:MAG: hypothetical protein LBK50_00945 [Candidatus Nomurabacteria bacterium]|jgi:sugar-specific transcriptional regulator TrmB|nr:hypothetical protein [Candidatus Nomurabacteria bacterium]
MDDKTSILDIISTLKKAGLTDSQAKAYFYLVENGVSTPTDMAKGIDESRTNGYMIAEKLERMGLIKINQAGKNTLQAENPIKLKSYLLRRQRQIRDSNNALDGILPQLTSKYHLLSDQPGVITAEGAEALRIVYDAIIKTGEEVLIFPTPYDREDAEMSKMIDKQIERQNRAGIRVKSLIHEREFKHISTYANELLEIRQIPNSVQFDAQIMVFGNNIVFTVYNTGLVSTILTSPQAATTLRSAFFAIWDCCGDK